MTVARITSIIQYILVVISVAAGIVFFVKNGQIDPDTDFSTQMVEFGGILEFFLTWTYILMGIALVSTVLFSIYQMASDPKGAIKSLIGLAAFAVVVVIAYSLGDGTELKILGYTGSDNVESILKWADASIYTMYFLFAFAIVLTLFSEVAKAFK